MTTTEGPTVPRCHCRYPGDLDTPEHRRHHRDWERDLTAHPPTLTEATSIEVTDMLVTLDQLIAHTHGGPRPALTPGAQAVLALHARR